MKVALIVVSAVLVGLTGTGTYFFLQEYQPTKQDYEQVSAVNSELLRKVQN